ncbi:hypothetical protein [Luteolibacter marinus]|nr:hypothetical protein [Luteolibacter marinus]
MKAKPVKAKPRPSSARSAVKPRPKKLVTPAPCDLLFEALRQELGL